MSDQDSNSFKPKKRQLICRDNKNDSLGADNSEKILKRKVAGNPKIETLKCDEHNVVEEEKVRDFNSDALFQKNNLHEISLSVPYKNKEIPAVLNYSNSKLNDVCWVVLTHGAGGDLNTPQLKAVASFLAAENLAVLRFTCKGLNIKYRINVFCEILRFLHKKYNPKGIFIGGRSMGSRAAVMLLSSEGCEKVVLDKLLGVLCLSYPLHQVKNTSKLRDGPLNELKTPIFFLSGNNDEMCEKDVLEETMGEMTAPHQIFWLEGYNHSASSSSNYRENAYLKAFQEILKWCRKIQETI